MRLIYVCLTLLAFASVSQADWVIGKGGYYYLNGVGQPHVRSVSSAGGWYYDGCRRYYSYPTYSYTAVLEAEDFWEILAKGAANEKEKALRVKALEVVTGYQASGYSQSLSLYGPTALAYSPKFAEPVDYGRILQDYFLGVREVNSVNASAQAAASAVATKAAENDQEAQFRAFVLRAIESARPSAVLKTNGVAVQPEVRVLGGANPKVVVESCVLCHSGPEAKGGLDFSDWSKVEDKVKAVAWVKIRAGEMPPAKAVQEGKVKAVDRARAKEVFE